MNFAPHSTKLNPLTFFVSLFIGGGLIVVLVYIGTQGSLSTHLHIPSLGAQTAAEQAAKQAASTRKIAACVKSVQSQWNPVLKLAESENLPLATYDADEQQLIVKCQKP
jgi:hypothetical protein